MTYGLRVKKANGDISLEITDRCTRYYGRFSASMSVVRWYQGGVALLQALVSVPGFADDGTWFVGGVEFVSNISNPGTAQNTPQTVWHAIQNVHIAFLATNQVVVQIIQEGMDTPPAGYTMTAYVDVMRA